MKLDLKKFMLVFLVVLFATKSTDAQLHIIIGTQGESSGTSAAPYTNNSKSYRIQMVYTASEINTALSNAGISTGSPRNIVGLSWDINSNHALNDLSNYSISMGNTNSTDLQSHSYDASTQVKSSHTLSPNGTGWHYIEFDDSFEWDGTSHIIVDVCWSTSYSSNGASSWMYDDGSGEYRMRWENSGFSNMCGGMTWSTNLSNPDLKARVRFAFACDPIEVSVTPVSDLCNSSTIASLTGNEPASGHTGQWTVVSGSGTFTNDSHYNSEVTNVSQGQNVYRWTITKTADGCSEYADLTVTNNTPTTANAGTSDFSCSPEYNLNGNSPTYGTGVWTVTGGTGVFSDNSLYNSTVSNLTGSDAGTDNKFTWTITQNGCSTSDEVTIKYYLPPVASVTTSPLTGCYYDSGVTLTLNGNDAASLDPPATGQWSVISGSGTFNNSAVHNTTVTNIGTPTNTYRWTVSRNGCNSSVNLVVNNSSPSLASAGPDQTISNSSSTMQANVPSQGTGTWSVNPSGPTFANANLATTVVNNIAENIAYTFIWTISNSSCDNTEDEIVIVRMDDLSGLVIQDNLTNNGTMIQTEDSNPFSMNGNSKYIYGGLSSVNTFTDTKLKVVGSITFDGEIDNGKFASTTVVPIGTFIVNDERVYKNHDFSNIGIAQINANATIQNSGDWINSSTVVAHNTSTVIFNGNELQEVTTNWDGTNNAFGNLSIAQTVVTPQASNGIELQDDMALQASSNLILTKGVLTIKNTDKKLIIYNNSSTAISGNYEQSWVYATPGKTLRRYLANVSDQQYAFPVGTATHSNLALFTNNNMPDGTLSLDAYFRANPANVNVDFPAPLEEETADDYIRYTQVHDYGVWGFIPTGDINPAGTYHLELSLNGFDMTGASDNLYSILKRPLNETTGENWNIPPTTSEFIASTIASNKAKRNTIASFSEFGIGLGASILPVKLLNFDAICETDKISIKWTTSVEINNDFFTLEKSFDGIDFLKIATINGAGNSNQLNHYSFSEAKTEKTVYYRLSQTDFDGKSETFPMIAQNCYSNENIFVVYPNPCSDYLFIKTNHEDSYSIEITNTLGERIYKEEAISDFNKIIYIQDYAPGLYVLKISNDRNQNLWFKIIKK